GPLAGAAERQPHLSAGADLRRETGRGVRAAGEEAVTVPRTLREVDLPRRIRAAGGANLKEAGEFFGWEAARITKTASDFTKDELLAKGWTKERLLDVAEGYEHIAR